MYYWGGDHETADQGCMWLFGCRLKSMGVHRLQPVGCMPTLSVVQKCRLSRSVRLLALYKCYLRLPTQD